MSEKNNPVQQRRKETKIFIHYTEQKAKITTFCCAENPIPKCIDPKALAALVWWGYTNDHNGNYENNANNDNKDNNDDVAQNSASSAQGHGRAIC